MKTQNSKVSGAKGRSPTESSDKCQNNNLKLKTFAFCVLIFNFLALSRANGLIFNLARAQSARADTLKSNNYTLDGTNLNMTSGEKSSQNYKVTDTVGQLGPGKYGSNGYIVKAGFQDMFGVVYFKFSLSKTSINFGSLTPNNFTSDSATMAVSGAGSHGYHVTALADGLLRKNEKVNIPNTKCDDPKNSCTVSLAKPWIDPKNFGFGYNLQGQDIPSTFAYGTYFRPFPLQNEGNKAETVMRAPFMQSERKAVITFKVNIPKGQEAGQYQNIISFVAIPTY